jgi:hypothetical protein
MKDSKYRDPRMVAYYREVRRVDDMYYGLELNYILWWDNEAANALEKMASGRGPSLQGFLLLTSLSRPFIMKNLSREQPTFGY